MANNLRHHAISRPIELSRIIMDCKISYSVRLITIDSHGGLMEGMNMIEILKNTYQDSNKISQAHFYLSLTPLLAHLDAQNPLCQWPSCF